MPALRASASDPRGGVEREACSQRRERSEDPASEVPTNAIADLDEGHQHDDEHEVHATLIPALRTPTRPDLSYGANGEGNQGDDSNRGDRHKERTPERAAPVTARVKKICDQHKERTCADYCSSAAVVRHQPPANLGMPLAGRLSHETERYVPTSGSRLPQGRNSNRDGQALLAVRCPPSAGDSSNTMRCASVGKDA
jgi:hypothetical protein